MGDPEKSYQELMSLICPKCGFEQEERLECLKCGVVFSKFISFHAPEKSPRPDSPEHGQNAASAAEDSLSFDPAELRLQVRELSRRFSEVEFERVERTQLRTDFRALDKKFQSELENLCSRLEALEKLANDPPEPPPAPEGPDLTELARDLQASQVDPLVRRLDELERRVEEIVEVIAPQPDPQTVSLLERLDARTIALEAEIANSHAEHDSRKSAVTEEIRNNVQSLKSEVDVLRAASEQNAGLASQLSEIREQAELMRAKLQLLEDTLEQLSSSVPVEAPPRAPLEEDVHYIRESLDEIRQFMARLSPKS